MKNKFIFILLLSTSLSFLGLGCTPKTQTSIEQKTEQDHESQKINENYTTETKNVIEVPAIITTSTESEAVKTQPTSTIKQATPTTIKPRTPTAGTTKPTTQTSVVIINDSKFSPQVMAIKAGDKVIWTNKDTTPHTVRSSGSLLWDSGTIRPGASFSHIFSSPGSYDYFCAIHTNMKGTIIVR